MQGRRPADQGMGKGEESYIKGMLHSLQEVVSLHDRGPYEQKWHLSAIRALRDSLVVGHVMPSIYRIADIKTGRFSGSRPRPDRSLFTPARQPSRRDHCGGSDPPQGRGKWWTEGWTTYPSPVPHQRSKRGGRSLHHHPSRAVRRARREHASRHPATAVSADARNPCQTASNKAFQARPRPQQRGLRSLREKHCGGQERAPLEEPPPLFQWRMPTTAPP